MSCSLTTGYALGCRDSVGGIKEIRLAVYNTSGSFTTNGSGTVTSFTGYASGTAGNNPFYKYDLTKATSQFTETINASTENGSLFYQQDLTLVINKLQVQVRNEMLVLAQNRLVAIVRDRMDQYWILGSDTGLEVTAGTSQTGTANGDRSGYELTFTAMDSYPMYSVSAANANLVTATSQMIGS
jgi:hypothetical protein